MGNLRSGASDCDAKQIFCGGMGNLLAIHHPFVTFSQGTDFNSTAVHLQGNKTPKISQDLQKLPTKTEEFSISKTYFFHFPLNFHFHLNLFLVFSMSVPESKHTYVKIKKQNQLESVQEYRGMVFSISLLGPF